MWRDRKVDQLARHPHAKVDFLFKVLLVGLCRRETRERSVRSKGRADDGSTSIGPGGVGNDRRDVIRQGFAGNLIDASKNATG